MNKALLIFIFSFFAIESFSQKKEWLEKEYRDSIFPHENYFKQYFEIDYDKNISKSENKSIAFEKAKIEFCKKLVFEISTSSTFSKSEVTKITSAESRDDVYNSVYNQTSSTSSSASISGLTEDYFFSKRKKCHVFIYVKKEDYKKATLKQYKDLIITIDSEIATCQEIYINNNLRSAKTKGDQIRKSLKNISRKISLLSALNVNFNLDDYIKLKQDFDPLYAKIDEQVSRDEDYKYNKTKGDIYFSSNDIDELENALYFYKKAQSIDPTSSFQDNIHSSINQIKEILFEKFCIEASNLEKENKFDDAIIVFKKAREINQNGDFMGDKLTDKIINLQLKIIDSLILKGKDDLENNPSKSLVKFKQAKKLSYSTSENLKLKEIEKLIIKAERKIKRIKETNSKNVTKNKLQELKSNSPNRFVFKLGGGFNTPHVYDNLVFSNAIDIKRQLWQLSSTVALRTNTKSQIKTSKTGFELTKGNLIGFFGAYGVHQLSNPDTSILVNTKELEFGFVLREFLRLSFGVGKRDINQNEFDSFLQNYYSGTAGLVFNFKNRISLETYISYVFDNDLNIQSSRFKSMLALRFYIYQKAYKIDRKNTKRNLN
jgi:glycerophosphoryl diester phosphodiesterase